MKVTQQQLNQIIKEEVQRALNEAPSKSLSPEIRAAIKDALRQYADQPDVHVETQFERHFKWILGHRRRIEKLEAAVGLKGTQQ